MSNNITYYELDIFIDENQKDLISSFLDDLGVHDFEYGSVECDIEAEYDPQKQNHDYYNEAKKDSPIIIYSEDKKFLESIQTSLKIMFNENNIKFTNETFHIKPLADQNWKESWKASFKPIVIADRIVILPPWESNNNYKQQHQIVIDPGMAFGTGQHETTQLCLEAMLKYNVPSKVLDVGTGSGILAIAAMQLGATYVIGNDLDSDCIRIANENAVKNNVAQISFTNEAIENITENNFDMIIANIQSNPLKKIMKDIYERISTQGIIILSGILTSEVNDFSNFLLNMNFNIISCSNLGDWSSIVCQKKL